jgi:hypothetical protein
VHIENWYFELFGDFDFRLNSHRPFPTRQGEDNHPLRDSKVGGINPSPKAPIPVQAAFMEGMA